MESTNENYKPHQRNGHESRIHGKHLRKTIRIEINLPESDKVASVAIPIYYLDDSPFLDIHEGDATNTAKQRVVGR